MQPRWNIILVLGHQSGKVPTGEERADKVNAAVQAVEIPRLKTSPRDVAMAPRNRNPLSVTTGGARRTTQVPFSRNLLLGRVKA